MEWQGKKACQKIKANPHFNDTRFNIIGLSQGGIIARYIVQQCDTKFYVNNLLTVSSPHMGVQNPSCVSGIGGWCWVQRFIFGQLLQTAPFQSQFGPTNYIRPSSTEHDYVTYTLKNKLLPYLNNEVNHKNFDIYKDRVSRLNSIMLAMNIDDITLYPRQSAHFESLG